MKPEPPFLELIPPSLHTDEFLRTWTEWVDERKCRRNKITPRAAKLQLNKCAVWGPRKSVDSIIRSIECGWSGLFEVIPNQRQQPDRPVTTLFEKIINEIRV